MSDIDVKKIATLARLELSDEEANEFQQQLSSIFDYFEEISDISTENIEPLVTPTQMEQHLRADKSLNMLQTEEALKNAPEKSGNLFKVPPVV